MVGMGGLKKRSRRLCASLLSRCLRAHNLEDAVHENLLAQVNDALGLGLEGCDADDQEDLGSPDSKKPRNDEHNEVCEVCEKGGDLLCCDTCNLVFHLACLRPKLSVIPKGKWSCAHCILDGVAIGDKAAANSALRSMSRVARGGADSGDEAEGGSAAEQQLLQQQQAHQQELRLARSGEITIVRSGKRYIVRKTSRSQIVELDRYDTLEKALSSLVGMKAESEELWCMYCLDDDNLQMCAFCGCRSCFGKHDDDNLLLCDGCNQEWHTYCLNPPLTSIPSNNWYCVTCLKSAQESGDADNDSDNYEDSWKKKDGRRKKSKVVGSSGSPTAVAGSTDASGNWSRSKFNKVPGRGRGRPPGSGRKSKDGMAWEGDSANEPNSTVVMGDGDKKSGSSVPASSSTSVAKSDELPGPPPVVDAVGVDAALTIVAKMGKREANKTQLFLLEQLREWAPIGDLEAVLRSLIVQRDSLLAEGGGGTGSGSGFGTGVEGEEKVGEKEVEAAVPPAPAPAPAPADVDAEVHGNADHLAEVVASTEMGPAIESGINAEAATISVASELPTCS